jgi:hypothetical protein
MTKTTILAACAAALLSSAAVAQRLPPPPEGPTVVECNQGYNANMPWTLQEFTTACAKLREDKGTK